VTLLLAIQPSGGNWSPPAWHERFSARLPGRALPIADVDVFDPAAITAVAAWKPPPGLLATLPNLRVIFNLGAGVDALLADPTLPQHVPIVRVVTADLTRRMTEYIVWQVLDQHRRGPMLRAAQARGDWLAKDQWAAHDMRVGLMGLGEIAQDAAAVLVRLGFQVSGWSRTPRRLDGVTTYAGADGLAPFLATTDILVAALPLTPQTRGVLNRRLFEGLARDGKLGAPVVINVGRGGLHVEADVLACLDEGILGAAVLDVFEVEPLPAASPLWRHPRVTLTPHNAADSDPDAISGYVAGQLLAFEAGQPLVNVVDRRRGY
jgi:glyoxylate/hydroxypyruvate reductase A